MAFFSVNGGLIPQATDAGTIKEVERTWKGAATAALATEAGMTSIMDFKANGSVTGHKVGDNIDAVRALAASCGAQWPVLATSKINDFRKSQLLDAVLRPYQEIGKDGKFTGAPGAKLVKLGYARPPQGEVSQASE